MPNILLSKHGYVWRQCNLLHEQCAWEHMVKDWTEEWQVWIFWVSFSFSDALLLAGLCHIISSTFSFFGDFFCGHQPWLLIFSYPSVIGLRSLDFFITREYRWCIRDARQFPPNLFCLPVLFVDALHIRQNLLIKYSYTLLTFFSVLFICFPWSTKIPPMNLHVILYCSYIHFGLNESNDILVKGSAA